METVRITAKTLDEAITKACIELGATSGMISYEILETGSNGVFGIGARPYVIEAKKKQEETEPISVKQQADEQLETKKELGEAEKLAAKKPFSADDYVKKAGTAKAALQSAARKPEPEVAAAPASLSGSAAKESEQDAAVLAAESQSDSETSADILQREATEEKERPIQREPRVLELSEEEKQEAVQTATSFLQIIFDGMGMEVQIAAEFDAYGELLLNLSGEEMGVLIGKRGQTLDALQYLLSQVVNKHRSAYIRVRVDTENYRARRKEALESLARNISYKVRRNRRSVALEPMNPYERRIIHSVLQNERDVATRSEGEEPYRHVVVYCTRRRR